MTVLLYGDTVRNPALRHAVPLAIVDPFLFVERDGRQGTRLVLRVPERQPSETVPAVLS